MKAFTVAYGTNLILLQRIVHAGTQADGRRDYGAGCGRWGLLSLGAGGHYGQANYQHSESRNGLWQAMWHRSLLIGIVIYTVPRGFLVPMHQGSEAQALAPVV